MPFVLLTMIIITITLDSWATLNEDTISRRYNDVAFQDVKTAFNLYLNEYNAGRPFILARFSQGGKYHSSY